MSLLNCFSDVSLDKQNIRFFQKEKRESLLVSNFVILKVDDVNGKPLLYKMISSKSSEDQSLKLVEILLNQGANPNICLCV